MLDQLVRDWSGRTLTVTGADAGQCTAVAHQWQQMLGLPIVYGHAIDTYANAPSTLYEKELNSVTAVPRPGAIMVWDHYKPLGMTEYGHTAVVTEANINNFVVFEQNNPAGNKCRIHRFNDYSGVIGWFYPKKLNEGGDDMSSAERQEIDYLRSVGHNGWSIVELATKREAEINKLTEQVAAAQKASATAAGALNESQRKLDECRAQKTGDTKLLDEGKGVIAWAKRLFSRISNNGE